MRSISTRRSSNRTETDLISARRVTSCRSRIGKSTSALRDASLQLEPRVRNEIPELLAIWAGL
ncbi:MAG TPA: hypothetical protein VJY33_16585 [Isosphaeraceae bacterium]|nr:hypothetical protein [Isosphaeraceae bacterium]